MLDSRNTPSDANNSVHVQCSRMALYVGLQLHRTCCSRGLANSLHMVCAAQSLLLDFDFAVAHGSQYIWVMQPC